MTANKNGELWACIADVLNQELRENYGGAFEVNVGDDWRPAIRALVDGVRYGEQLQHRAEIIRLTSSFGKSGGLRR